MSRLVEKIQLSLVLTRNTTRFLSRVSLSTLRLCKSLLTKTLGGLFSAMNNDYLFSSEDDDNLFDLDFQPNSNSSRQNNHFNQRSTNSRGLLDEDDRQKVYLVPYRWWKEAQTILADKVGGVLYEVSCNDDNADSGILLHLKKKEGYPDNDNGDGRASIREYALVPEGMWLQALKWHNDSKAAVKDLGSSFVADEQDVFPLQIRLSVSPETNSLLVKISLEDNKVDFYRRACKLFISMSAMFHIWDFSGQTAQFFNNDKVNLSSDFSGQSGEEVFLELQVHGFSDSTKERNDEMAGPYEINDSFCNGSVKMNGSNDNLNSYITSSNSIRRHSGNGGVGLLGLTGLQNLGNTCFMNSAIQCLAHTPEIVDYFLGDYQKEINNENPLGLNGELALAFGDLIRKLWAPGGMPVAPRMFKLKLANFAPQFSGYNQHDSQEFLAFLLDGLHEDLNRVKCKPYIEAKDAEGNPEEEVAEEYWRNHRARNDSIIVDFFQGQYRSKLVCPCQKLSLTFDPLMYLSLPIPSTTMRTMIVTVLSTDGSTLPIPFTLTVPKYGRFQDLIDALSTSCSLRNDEKLLVAEIYKNKIFRVLEEPSDLLALIRDEDKLVAYRLPKDSETSSLVVFMHQREEKSYSFGGGLSLDWKMFGTPLVARFPDLTNGSDIRKLFLKLLDPFPMPVEDDSNSSDEVGNVANGDSVLEDFTSHRVSDNDAVSDSETGDQPHLCDDFQFYHMYSTGPSEIKMNEPLSISYYPKPLNIYVRWSERMIEKYDTCLLSSLMEVCRPQLFTRMAQESVSLYKCLEAFLKEEPLGPEDMWYCPRCEMHRQASKKLDLWRLPYILVIHLKRFSFSRYFKSKLETYVDFPIDDLDLSNYISCKNSRLPTRYVLYAISNHYGGMGGGHYTALVNLGHKRWFEFDDDRVYPVGEDSIKTSAAYVLFYRRVSDI